MGIARFNRLAIVKLLCISIYSAHYPAYADTTPPPELDFRGQYEFTLLGILFGKMGIEAEQDASHYAITTDITSAGVINIFTKHSSHTVVNASGNAYQCPERAYESRYRTKQKKRHIKLVYKNGALIEDIAKPADAPGKRPPVPQALKDNADDPLSFIISMRSKLVNALQNNASSYSTTVYDGRRLTEANFTLQGKNTIAFYGKDTSVITLAVRRKLLEGFSKKELDDYNEKEPTLYVHFSDDGRFIPLQLDVHSIVGTIHARLVKECGKGESCLLGLTE